MTQTPEQRKEAQRLAKRRSRAKLKAAGKVEIDKRTNADRASYFRDYRRKKRAELKQGNNS